MCQIFSMAHVQLFYNVDNDEICIGVKNDACVGGIVL